MYLFLILVKIPIRFLKTETFPFESSACVHQNISANLPSFYFPAQNVVLNVLQNRIICKLLEPSVGSHGLSSYVLTSDKPPNCSLGAHRVTFFLVTQEEELCILSSEIWF